MGNFTAQKHVDFANRILDRRGFGSARVNMYWLSGAEADKLVKSVEDTFEKVRMAGPNPIKEEHASNKEPKQEITPPVG